MTIRDKILVVEDEKTISGLIRAILTANGYDVILASTGSEAFSMISSHCPDLVVLDLGLPDMDGMDIISAVRSWTSMPIIVVSARSYERDKVQALDKGADDYVTKPFSPAELLPHLFDGSLQLSGRAGADSSRCMGIGLSVCRTIVEAHGGSLRAENLPEGARFEFTLPLEDAQ